MCHVKSGGMVSLVNCALWTNPSYMCPCVVYVGYVSFHGHASKVRSHIAHERMTSSGDRHQGWVGQVQDEHLKKITCLNLAVHLVIMDMWRCASMELSHHGVWGSICESSRSNNDQVRHFGLSGAWRVIIKIKRDAQGKGMALLGFPFTGLKVDVGRPDYRIDSRTIKRGFRLSNLITSS